MVNMGLSLASCYPQVNSNVLIFGGMEEPHNPLMTVEDIRLENLKLLIREFETAAEVADRAGTNASYLSQIINRVKSRTGKPREIGAALARKLEGGCGKERGWMDESHKPDIIGDEELRFRSLMRNMSDEDRQTWLKVGESFAKQAATNQRKPVKSIRGREMKRGKLVPNHMKTKKEQSK